MLAGIEFEEPFLKQIKDFGKKSEFGIGSLLEIMKLAQEQIKINKIRKMYEQKAKRERADNSASSTPTDTNVSRNREVQHGHLQVVENRATGRDVH